MDTSQTALLCLVFEAKQQKNTAICHNYSLGGHRRKGRKNPRIRKRLEDLSFSLTLVVIVLAAKHTFRQKNTCIEKKYLQGRTRTIQKTTNPLTIWDKDAVPTSGCLSQPKDGPIDMRNLLIWSCERLPKRQSPPFETYADMPMRSILEADHIPLLWMILQDNQSSRDRMAKTIYCFTTCRKRQILAATVTHCEKSPTRTTNPIS